MSFDKAQLKKAVEHLAFDEYHFRCYAHLLRGGRLRPTVEQAFIYSLLLHFRILLDFFYGKPEKDDVSVNHFRRCFREFETAFPSTLPKLDDADALSKNLNKRLVHFTATRWEKRAPSMKYYARYFGRIEKLIAAFQMALPEDVRQVFAEWLQRWERMHPGTV
jgi:hypothetical protein